MLADRTVVISAEALECKYGSSAIFYGELGVIGFGEAL